MDVLVPALVLAPRLTELPLVQSLQLLGQLDQRRGQRASNPVE